ncbi:cell surface protein [Flavobacteriaceae bacterium M23B6Z8]
MKMKIIIRNSVASVILAMLLLISCTDTNNQIAQEEDYKQFLIQPENKNALYAAEEIDFWTNKLKKSPNQISWLVKLAAAHTLAFHATGNISELKKAEKQLLKANLLTRYENASFLRSLAHNYSTQHRFQEALTLLDMAYELGENRRDTNKMLFDVHLELGNLALADTKLRSIERNADFDYYIRLAKWQDHQGELQNAIYTLEKATYLADDQNSKALKIWTYSNLADFYGHNGELEKSYQNYLKTLRLDPSNPYALKQIAWIVFSHDRKPEKALEIINAIQKNYQTPDLYLLQAEIAAYMGDMEKQENYEEAYVKMVKDEAYGDMYNAYSILLWADKSDVLSKKAVYLAQKEVANRPTPLAYDLLAWTYFKHGKTEEAKAIIEQQVKDKTFEPLALYHMAEILKASGDEKQLAGLKKELQQAYFELGPMVKKQIEAL